MGTTLIYIALILLLSAFFSGMEIAFVSSNKLRFEMDRASQSFTSKILAVFYAHPNNFISTLLVGNNIALVIYGILMAEVIDATLIRPLGLTDHEGVQVFIQTLLSTAIVLVTGEFLPKTLFKVNPNRMMRIMALPAGLFYVLLYPVSKFTGGISKLFLRMVGLKVTKTASDQAFTRVELDYFIQSNIDNVKDEEDITDEVKIFQNALDFSNVKVRDCMVPRTEIEAVEAHASMETLRNQFVESGKSKIIVYQEDIDNIVGFIHSSDLFRLPASGDWRPCVRDIPFVPETLAAHKLLKQLMQERKTLAVVVDEFGGTAGIVTLEDLVEEIFGEIEDEHDTTKYVAKRLSDGEYVLSGRLEISKANELLDLDLPESDEYLTVGGLILHHYRSFPQVNEVVRVGHFEFKIVKNAATRIEIVKLRVNS